MYMMHVSVEITITYIQDITLSKTVTLPTQLPHKVILSSGNTQNVDKNIKTNLVFIKLLIFFIFIIIYIPIVFTVTFLL